jgi:glutathione peroxidase
MGGKMKLFLVLLVFMNSVFARDLYSINEKSIQGEEFKMSALKDKVVLIVNIASQCGYTGQLEKLEKLHRKYKDKNFVVLGVPTNDFGGQTPQDDQGMLEFCKKNYDATFPILTKKTIQGKEKRDLYKFLTEETPKNLQGEVGWNFEKFLINKKGEVIGRFRPSMDPLDKDLAKKIEAAL